MVALLDRFKGYLVAVGAALVLALGAYLRGRSALVRGRSVSDAQQR